MLDFMAIAKALADENRVRLLLALQKQELCVCQLIELISLAPSTVSKHMSILRQARLVEARKEGRWVYYRLAGCGASPTVREALAWVRRSLAEESQVARDAARLEEILEMDPEALCEKQCAHQRACTTSHSRSTAAGKGASCSTRSSPAIRS